MVQDVWSFTELDDEIFCMNSCNLDKEVRAVGQKGEINGVFQAENCTGNCFLSTPL